MMRHHTSRRTRTNGDTHAFTLIEILIVVVILGILAAIVVPSMGSAALDTRKTTTFSEVQKIRRHIEVYKIQNDGLAPPVIDGTDVWPGIVPQSLGEPPTNAWVGGANARVIHVGNAPDAGYHTNYGWIFDPVTGHVWAAGFDANDEPFPIP